MSNSTTGDSFACNSFFSGGASPQIHNNLARHEGQASEATRPDDGFLNGDLRAGLASNFRPEQGEAPWYIANITAAQQPRGFEPHFPNGEIQDSAAKFDTETGEIISDDKSFDPREARLLRFARQSAVRRLLPTSRTAKCLRLRQGEKAEGQASKFHTKDIEVWYSAESKSAHYKGLQTCASPWACPVCSAKISERRREELKAAIRQHEAGGGQVLMATFTNPHTRTDDLSDMIKAQALAMTRFTGARAVRALWDSVGCIGTVRSWEVTHGYSNGWHPHFHILLFVDTDMPLIELKMRLWIQWAAACRLAKLPTPSLEHGVDLRDGSAAAAYVSKGLWGLDQEMTKGHIKKAKQGRRSPFQLIDSYMQDKDKAAGALFVEYAEAFKGRNQLLWSKGLKSQFDITEQTDEETAARVEESAFLLGRIEYDEWCLILRFDLRGDVLELARSGSWSPIRILIDDLQSRFSSFNSS